MPEHDVRQLAIWLQDYLNEMLDQQIETDLASGKLDCLIAQVATDIAISRVQELIKYLAE